VGRSCPSRPDSLTRSRPVRPAAAGRDLLTERDGKDRLSSRRLKSREITALELVLLRDFSLQIHRSFLPSFPVHLGARFPTRLDARNTLSDHICGGEGGRFESRSHG
jgi:hypothetical protein